LTINLGLEVANLKFEFFLSVIHPYPYRKDINPILGYWETNLKRIEP